MTPDGYPTERVEVAITDVLHRTLFGLRADVNVHPARHARRRPRSRFDPETTSTAPERHRGRIDDPRATPHSKRSCSRRGRDVFVDRGYHDTRVDDLVAAAGVSHGAFYRYFQNKEELARILTARGGCRRSGTRCSRSPTCRSSRGRRARACGAWLRRYHDAHVHEASMLRVWVDAAVQDPVIRAESAPLLDWGRRRMSRYLRAAWLRRREHRGRVRSTGMPVIQEAPIVTMRLAEIKGRKTADILADSSTQNSGMGTPTRVPVYLPRAIVGNGEDSRRPLDWTGRLSSGDVVPISLDTEIAKDFKTKIGDKLIFDVQGVPLKTTIASIRTIDWKRFQTNFFVLFPAGVLENAPTFHVLVSRVETPADSARLQNAVVAKYPNVSAIDLTSVIQTVDSILDKVALVIRVMSLFTVGAGIVVLTSTIWSGRYQRLQESILLRTLGASRAQIWKILCAEYFLLGVFASATGIILAVVSSWALARFVFQLSYAPSVWPLLVTAAPGQRPDRDDWFDREPGCGEQAAAGDPASGSGVNGSVKRSCGPRRPYGSYRSCKSYSAWFTCSHWCGSNDLISLLVRAANVLAANRPDADDRREPERAFFTSYPSS